MTRDEIEGLVSQITGSDSLSVFHAMCRKFSWAGTVFTPDDVEEAVQEHAFSNETELAPEQLEAAVQAVLNDSGYWKYFTDHQVRSGNEYLCDLVEDVQRDSS